MWAALARTEDHVRGLRNVQNYTVRLAVHHTGSITPGPDGAPKSVRKLLASYALPHVWLLLQYQTYARGK